MTILTTGVTGGDLVARQEIRTFMKDADLMNLFVQAVDRFQHIDQKDTQSWFQVAGIHGRPYIPFDGAGTAGSNFGGYCTHSSILFPPWHRPYLALFEQLLAKHVNDIANEFPDPDKQKYVAAAKRFRVPYWDWALDADLPDFISQQKQVTLNTPKGSKTIPNPLYSYTFHPVYSDFGDGLPDEKVWEGWKSTLRYPSNSTAAAVSRGDALEQNLNNNRLTLRDRAYNLLTQANSYEAFSNDGSLGSQASATSYDSLESIHGQIHGMVGRNGHMGVVDYAAFDPVFWLHHCNCDRLFAIWQALNPQSYVIPKVNQAGTFATKRGTLETVDSPLAPFWKTQGVFWTAAGVRDTRSLNYTYPELAKWATLSPAEKSTRLRTDVNALYGRTAPWGALNEGLFNVTPSFAKPAAATTGTLPTGGAAGAPRVAAQPAGQAAQAPLQVPAAGIKPIGSSATGAGATSNNPQSASATQPAAKIAVPPPATAASQVASTVAGAAVSAGAAVASGAQAVAASVPPSVAKPVAAAGSAVAGAAQKVAAAAPASISQPIAAAGASITSAAKATIAAAPSAPGAARQSFEIDASATQASDKKHYNEWLANITVEKYAAKTTLYVYIFLGDFSADPAAWGTDPNLVGTHVVFANNLNFTGCENCRDAAEKHKLVTGTIPLTGALGDRLGKDKVGTLEPAEIVPYLKKELHWRIQDNTDKVIERADLPSLKVSVARVQVALPNSIAEFPQWGNGQKEAGVTTGRPGGATEND